MSTHEELVHKFTAQASYDCNVFVMMRYRRNPHFGNIEHTIRSALAAHELIAHLAKDRAYSDVLWENLRVYMDGCRYGLAVFEEIDEREFNPNISLELGYMMAQHKRCLLLKERRMPRLPTDVCGFLYRDFDFFSIAESITEQINDWVCNDLRIEGKRIQTIREVGRIFTERKPGRGYKCEILGFLDSTESSGAAFSELKRAVYGASDREGGTLRRDLIQLMDLGVISSVRSRDAERFQLTTLGQEALLQHKPPETEM